MDLALLIPRKASALEWGVWWGGVGISIVILGECKSAREYKKSMHFSPFLPSICR